VDAPPLAGRSDPGFADSYTSEPVFTMAESAREILKVQTITSSAPCRIDSGGTWDIKALALPFERANPVTCNIALNLRTWVTLLPHRHGRVRVVSQGFALTEEFPFGDMKLTSPFNIFFAAVSYFGFHGLEIHIKSDSPPRSGLGGSSTALVALIKSLSKLDLLISEKRRSARDILHLAYHIEDGVSHGKCGMQDQAAALYGGVNLWSWRYGSKESPFLRSPLLRGSGIEALSSRLLVVHSGRSHFSHRTNRRWVADFLAGKTTKHWVKANDICREFAKALEAMDWKGAAYYLKRETAIRRRITPDAFTPLTNKLIRQAEAMGCGARFAGAGAGGAVWAIGGKEDIEGLKKKWKASLARVRTAEVLDCGVDPWGAR